MDAGGAAESESGSAFSAAPLGEEVDFRLPVDWKNLLKTAWLAGDEPEAAAPPEAGFRRDVMGQGVTARGLGREGARASNARSRASALSPTSTSGPSLAPGRGEGRGRGLAGTNETDVTGRLQYRAEICKLYRCSPPAPTDFCAGVMVHALNCIVAVSQNMGIGKNGDLPWPRIRCLPGRGWVGVRGQRLDGASCP